MDLSPGTNVAGASDFFAVTPHNTDDVSYKPVRLFIGVGGDVNVKSIKGNTVLFKNVPNGTILPVFVTTVLATSTSATDIVGLL